VNISSLSVVEDWEAEVRREHRNLRPLAGRKHRDVIAEGDDRRGVGPKRYKWNRVFNKVAIVVARALSLSKSKKRIRKSHTHMTGCNE
jgi:hypothetical protein